MLGCPRFAFAELESFLVIDSARVLPFLSSVNLPLGPRYFIFLRRHGLPFSLSLTVAVRNWSIMVKKIGPPVWLRYELLRVISTAIGPNVDGIRTRSGPLKKVY